MAVAFRTASGSGGSAALSEDATGSCQDSIAESKAGFQGLPLLSAVLRNCQMKDGHLQVALFTWTSKLRCQCGAFATRRCRHSHISP